MRSRIRLSKKRRMSSDGGAPPLLLPPKGENGMIGGAPALGEDEDELEPPLDDAPLDLALPDELTFTLEYMAPSVC